LLPNPAVVLGGQDASTGGYVDPDGNGHWWVPSGRSFFHVEDVSAAEELERAPRRYADLERLNNLLRGRARAALLAWLTGMNRVPLPLAAGSFATSARDIGALLLLDVEAGVCEKASRIEEAITAVQSFVERARLPQEPTFAITPQFAAVWDKIFATFRIW
jgi:hypothetical protein